MDVVGPVTDWIVGGAGAGGGAVFVWKLFDWFGTRVDRREDVLIKMQVANADASAALILNLQDQVTKVCARLDTTEAELAECRNELAECRLQHAQSNLEIGRLKGVMQGYGDARQEAQRIVATALMDKDDKRGTD